MFGGFIEEHVDVGSTSLFARRGGEGPPILLLHGHPRTSSTWHRVAPQLVDRGFTVVCPDLLGYGRSGKPTPAPDHAPHSKRATADAMLALMSTLGHETFSLAGHDRGSYVALRLALDHPDTVSRLVLADCIPISEHLARADTEFAPAGGTGSSSRSPRFRNASSTRTRMPGTGATPTPWGRRTTSSGGRR